MYLQKLEIQGFKSFANKATLVFNRGLAAVVGPNGSGKSNIADAIRWVLGEQSMKMLRGKRSEDVIFSGSDKKGRLGSAEVSITINNEDRKMPVDFSEVVITRRVYRNGEGEYLLNMQPARLQDIVLLLAKSNFGQRAYSVIGQGMIDSILVASPQERKEFFDEAAGVRQYQIKREQAIHKLEATEANLRQAQLLLEEIEPRLRSLTRQVRRLERRQEVETELRDFQVGYYRQLWAELQEQHSDKRQAYNQLERIQREARTQVESIQRQLEKMESAKTQDESFRDLQKDYSRLLSEKNELLKEQAVLRGRQELKATEQGQLNLVWLTNHSAELERTLGELKEEADALETEIARQRETLTKRTAEQAKVLAEFQTLEQELISAGTRLESANRLDIAQLRTDIEGAFADQLRLVEAFKAVSDLSSLAKLRAQAEKVSRALRDAVDRLKRQASGDPQAVLKLQAQLTAFMKTKDSLVNEVRQLESAIVQRNEKLEALKLYRERLEAERQRVVDELSRAKAATGSQGEALELFSRDDAKLSERIETIDRQLKQLAQSIGQFNVKAQTNREELFSLQKSFRSHQQILTDETAKLNVLQVELAKLETHQDDLKREIETELPADRADKIWAVKKMSEVGPIRPLVEYQDEIQKLKHALELVGGIDQAVTEEYQSTSTRHEFLSTQSKDLAAALGQLQQVIAELDNTIKHQFDESFERINERFQHYFRVLFRGGHAKLVLKREEILAKEELAGEEAEDEETDEADEAPAPKPKAKVEKVVTGIEITATPPGKKLTTIAMLSGGERALTSIALIAAIIASNPAPFVFLDEVDAALDEANSQRFAAIIEELGRHTQFVVITHNRTTMEKAALLYGVTMGNDGVSKLLSVKMEEAEAVIKKHGNR